mgnify:FL=1
MIREVVIVVSSIVFNVVISNAFSGIENSLIRTVAMSIALIVCWLLLVLSMTVLII